MPLNKETKPNQNSLRQQWKIRIKTIIEVEEIQSSWTLLPFIGEKKNKVGRIFINLIHRLFPHKQNNWIIINFCHVSEQIIIKIPSTSGLFIDLYELIKHCSSNRKYV